MVETVGGCATTVAVDDAEVIVVVALGELIPLEACAAGVARAAM